MPRQKTNVAGSNNRARKAFMRGYMRRGFYYNTHSAMRRYNRDNGEALIMRPYVEQVLNNCSR